MSTAKNNGRKASSQSIDRAIMEALAEARLNMRTQPLYKLLDALDKRSDGAGAALYIRKTIIEYDISESAFILPALEYVGLANDSLRQFRLPNTIPARTARPADANHKSVSGLRNVKRKPKTR
jgi:hypothetical protein